MVRWKKKNRLRQLTHQAWIDGGGGRNLKKKLRKTQTKGPRKNKGPNVLHPGIGKNKTRRPHRRLQQKRENWWRSRSRRKKKGEDIRVAKSRKLTGGITRRCLGCWVAKFLARQRINHGRKKSQAQTTGA